MELKELLDYLKDNVYVHMDKKTMDEQYKKGGLNTELLKNIIAYKNLCVVEELKKHLKATRAIKSGADWDSDKVFPKDSIRN